MNTTQNNLDAGADLSEIKESRNYYEGTLNQKETIIRLKN